MRLPAEVANEIARLMRDPDALRHERERVPPSGRRGHYDPNQPRVSAGNSDGGQWTDAGHNSTERKHGQSSRHVAIFFDVPPKRDLRHS
jgi:hypothetical protein